ncbi:MULTISPECIES: CDP-glucose 4,6-dehydratase [unclassified Bradyrhizobium]|uniref:CDP-glucose 4,6-dehydratase n=1 Tax=unclassified Bradyrhizobium TaxID=2631580 RepID=UPI001FF950C2|nr:MULTISPECIES: CDP-glucose 4,6-dehydratase [unclassified Bradyrhizobium]MCK1534621.1 CDP-glucose 4,6-dehydratase [Bradyrhizobium sp. 176]MCK1557858.1 CDP-glucose 4,6-dehydratase [Bradyrhizobium sp. 171]UPJ98291.1 CDP-glucose 4,6-dehydratase [Bradyrhizobium sp. 172]
MFADVYEGRHVLVTGHSGFKGSWLTLWLELLGAKVTGISLPPESSPNHWDVLGLKGVASHYVDIRSEQELRKTIVAACPDAVFHLAAQPLVRRSYRSPLETWATNVMGTAHVLEACRQLPDLEAVVVVTTDKCYENNEWVWGYRENDPLGGYDPYSASKAGSELVAASFRRSYFSEPDSALLASARAGNVIGGGDWSEDRLVPDLVRAASGGTPVEIRSPNSTRPWQHVLECLSGYLLLGQRLLQGDRACAEPWNFGPGHEGNRTVKEVLTTLKASWPAVDWLVTDKKQPHEAKLLQLDSTKAHWQLKWRPVWSFEEGVAATANWYRAWLEGNAIVSREQLHDYIRAAAERGLVWAQDT